MNVKMIVEEWLKEHKFDGLCNLDMPCGCLCGDLAPCGELYEDCRPGYREDVDENGVCQCDGEGTKHWHVCIENGVNSNAFSDASEWLCECGQRCVPTASDWRWNGRNWEHHHGYPIGHVHATRSPNITRCDQGGRAMNTNGKKPGCAGARGGAGKQKARRRIDMPKSERIVVFYPMQEVLDALQYYHQGTGLSAKEYAADKAQKVQLVVRGERSNPLPREQVEGLEVFA